MFNAKMQLKYHMMRHTGIKNYVCSTCGMRKTTPKELRVHMRIHTDFKYTCKFCQAEFKQHSNMQRHIRVVHHGIKSYICPHCDHAFGKAESLKYHIMTHTNERPLKCSLCDRRFIQPSALKTHMKTHNK